MEPRASGRPEGAEMSSSSSKSLEKIVTAGSVTSRLFGSHNLSSPSLDPAGGPHIVPSTARSKLAVLSERLQGFERQLETETKQRRDGEEERNSAVREAIAKLEKTLNSEIKRRVEANKALQTMFENQISTVQDKLEAFFIGKLDQLQVAADSLTERLTVAERELAVGKEKYFSELEDKNAMVAKDITVLQKAFDADRQSRQERETQLATRLGDIEYRTESKFDKEAVQREQRYEAVKNEVDEAKRTRDREDEKFQNLMLEEIASLKNGLIMESQARESADDDIVQAVNHYTTALQDALRLVNTT